MVSKIIKEIEINFKKNELTNYSGIYPVLLFLKKIGFNNLLNEYIKVEEKRNQKYSFKDIILGIICGIIGGANRIKKIEIFSKDPLFREVLYLKEGISDSTIGKRIRGIGISEAYAMNELIGAISRKIHAHIKTDTEIVDCDSTVKTVYGNQEGASKGYNPEKNGKKSYHPILAFLGSTKECILSYLRPGNVHTSNNANEFIKHVLGIINKEDKEIIFRMDSGFFSEEVIKELDGKEKLFYVIKVKMKNLEGFLENKEWEKIEGAEGWEKTEFTYKCVGWEKARRFLAVRKYINTELEGRIFKEDKYEYYCYCTNIKKDGYEIHKFYGERGTSENWIEAVKKQMCGGMLITQDFWVNDFLWNCCVLAYNILIWMRYLVDKKSHTEEPETFRLWFIKVAGKIVSHSNKVKLILSKNFIEYERWKIFYYNLCKLQI